MDPRIYRQWPLQVHRPGGRAVPGLILKAEQMQLPGVSGVRHGPSTFKMPVVGETKPSKAPGPEAFQPPQTTTPPKTPPTPPKTEPSVVAPVVGGKELAGGKGPRAARVAGPNIMGSFGLGVALGQTAASQMGAAHTLGLVGGAVAGKVHGVMQPQDSDRDRQMRDAYQQRAEQLLIMRRQAGESQASMGKAVPLVVSGVRRIGHE